MTRTIISLICLIGAGALFFFYTKPAYDGTRTTQNQIAQYDLALNKAAELQKLKQSLLSRYNAFNPDNIDRLHKLLPDHVDNVRLVLDLDTLASKHGLALQNVVIASPGQAKTTAAPAAIGPSLQKYDSLTLRFATTGTYSRFVEFLSELEQSLRIVDVTALQINLADSAGTDPNYRFDITLRTYWLK